MVIRELRVSVFYVVGRDAVNLRVVVTPESGKSIEFEQAFSEDHLRSVFDRIWLLAGEQVKEHALSEVPHG